MTYTSMLLLAGVLVVTSCNNPNLSTTHALIVGKWKLSHVSTHVGATSRPASGDTDSNTTMIEGPVPDSASSVITFNPDGTGRYSADANAKFKWTLSEDNTYLNITDLASNVTNYLMITKISDAKFTVKDTTAHPTQWETFKKL